MRTQALGGGGLTVSRLAYGCWRLAGSEDGPPAEPGSGERAVLAAADAGFTFFDLADIYGGGQCEEIFGRALRGRPGLRERLVVATKCGIRRPGDGGPGAPYRYDFSAEHILRSVDHSLLRLGLESVDLLILHRPDLIMQPDEVAGAFAVLREAGKVREFGASNFRPSQFTLLQSRLLRPMLTHQIQLSLSRLEAFEDGTLDQCQTAGVTPTAWSPLAGGRLLQADPEGKLATALKRVAGEVGGDPATVALAWLQHHPAGVIPVIGSVRPERIRAAAQADALRLTREQWYSLLEAARGARLP